MPTTSSPTSGGPSTASSSTVALGGWLALAALQIALAFGGAAGSEDEGGAGDSPLYDWALAVGSLVAYSVLVALTVWIASAYPDRAAALGLRRFRLRWLGATAGVIVASVIVSAALEPVLHAGEEQGLSPEAWRPDRATAFAVNALLITTLVPFAEELFFRGLGVHVLGRFGAAAGIGGTAILFALAHGIPVAVPALLFFALGLGWVRARSGSVWPGVVAHAAYNGIGLAIAFVALD